MTRFLILIFFLISIASYSQRKATTSDGRTVILNEDGTWKLEDKPNPPKSSFEPKGTCDFWIKEQTDKVEGVDFIKNKEEIKFTKNIKSKDIDIGLFKTKEHVLLKLYISKTCFEEKSKVIFLFEDNTRLQLTTANKENCKGEVSIYLDDDKEKEELIAKKISIIRVYLKQGPIEQSPTLKEQEQFSNVLHCLGQ